MASLRILRHAIPTKRPKGIAVDLIGTGTTWSGATTWSVSGVAGCSIVGQGTIAATTARLVIATGATTGTLTVSDGTNTATLSVWDQVNLAGARRWTPLRRGLR